MVYCTAHAIAAAAVNKYPRHVSKFQPQEALPQESSYSHCSFVPSILGDGEAMLHLATFERLGLPCP